MVLSKTRITKALIRLRWCVDRSAPVFFANPRRQVFFNEKNTGTINQVHEIYVPIVRGEQTWQHVCNAKNIGCGGGLPWFRYYVYTQLCLSICTESHIPSLLADLISIKIVYVRQNILTSCRYFAQRRLSVTKWRPKQDCSASMSTIEMFAGFSKKRRIKIPCNINDKQRTSVYKACFTATMNFL